MIYSCDCGYNGDVDSLVLRRTVSTKFRERGKEARACPNCLSPRCMTCGDPVSRNRVFCSSSCKQKIYSKGELNQFYGKSFSGTENGFYGKVHTKVTRKKMSSAHTPERREASAKLLREMWDDPEFRAKVPTTTVPKWHTSPKCGDIYYRSSYELRAYQILDNDVNVKFYCTERVSIEYVCDGKSKRYFPDILVEYVDGSFELIEIKSRYGLLETNTQLKVLAGVKWSLKNNIPYSVWSETELGLRDRIGP